MKLNISPKSPRIELYNDAFAKRKCCQVFAYESETFYRRRPNGISHCENGGQKPPKPPLPLARREPPFNTVMPRPTACTTPNRSSDGWGKRTYAAKSPFAIGYNGAPQIRPQKYQFPWTDPQTPLPASYLDPSDLWCQTASGSDPPYCYNRLDRPADARTHRATDRPRESLMTTGRYASNESDAA